MTRGECMKWSREAAGLSLSELSAISGIDRNSIHKIEKDQRSPTITTVEMLADALGLSIDEYIGHTTQERGNEMTRGEYMREARLAFGLSIEGLANMSGFAPQTIRNSENDKVIPRLDVVEVIADCLGITIEQYIGFDHVTEGELMTQNQQILNHLEQHGSITPVEAMNKYGIMRLASRISDLKKDGHVIMRDWIYGKNRVGDTVRFASYRLLCDIAKEEK